MAPIRPPQRKSSTADYAEYTIHPDRLQLTIMGQSIAVSRDEISQRKRARGTIPGDVFAVIQDLIADSLAPLTSRYSGDQLMQPAINFFSAFDNLHHSRWSAQINNQHMHSGDPASTFIQFRFPFIKFEWHVDTPYFELRELNRASGYIDIRTSWKAYASAGSNLYVAAGHIEDAIVLHEHGEANYPVISRRKFYVENVIQPELMRPKPLLRERPETTPSSHIEDQKSFVAQLSNSQRVLQMLRSSQALLGFVVAFSALLASMQPLVDKRTSIGGIVFAAVGIASALISVASLILGALLKAAEENAAKRQYQETTKDGEEEGEGNLERKGRRDFVEERGYIPERRPHEEMEYTGFPVEEILS